MTDKYTRRFLCYTRWLLYFAGILAVTADHGHLAFFLFFLASLLLRGKLPDSFVLMKRYKLLFFGCMAYYLCIFIYVVSVSGRVFDHWQLFLLLVFLPFAIEIVNIEIADYKGLL